MVRYFQFLLSLLGWKCFPLILILSNILLFLVSVLCVKWKKGSDVYVETGNSTHGYCKYRLRAFQRFWFRVLYLTSIVCDKELKSFDVYAETSDRDGFCKRKVRNKKKVWYKETSHYPSTVSQSNICCPDSFIGKRWLLANPITILQFAGTSGVIE
jgi:hypothetical protein